MGGMGGDTGEDISQPSLWIDAIDLGGDNKTVHGGCTLSAAIGPAEEPRFSSQGNLAAILPISGRMSSSIIAGIHCTGEARVVFRVSGAHQAKSCTWSFRPAL